MILDRGGVKRAFLDTEFQCDRGGLARSEHLPFKPLVQTRQNLNRAFFGFKKSPKEYTAFFHLHTFREDLYTGYCIRQEHKPIIDKWLRLSHEFESVCIRD
jgi:hypothetical protein